MIKNLIFKKYIENLIKKQYNEYKINKNKYNQSISLISNTTKKENKNDDYIKFYEGETETCKNEIIFSDGKLITFSKKNQTNELSEESNNLSNKKLEYNNYQDTQTFEKPSNSLSNKKESQKFKFSSKILENWEKNKMHDTEVKRQEMLNSKNFNIKSRTSKNDSNGKLLFYSYSNQIKKGNNILFFHQKILDFEL